MQPLPNILPSVETVCQHTIQKYKSMKYNWYKISMKYFDIKFLFKFYDWQLLLIIILDLLLPDRYSCCLLLYLGMFRSVSTSIQAVPFRNWRPQMLLWSSYLWESTSQICYLRDSSQHFWPYVYGLLKSEREITLHLASSLLDDCSSNLFWWTDLHEWQSESECCSPAFSFEL